MIKYFKTAFWKILKLQRYNTNTIKLVHSRILICILSVLPIGLDLDYILNQFLSSKKQKLSCSHPLISSSSFKFQVDLV